MFQFKSMFISLWDRDQTGIKLETNHVIYQKFINFGWKKSMLIGLKVLYSACKYAFYRLEHSARGRVGMGFNLQSFEMREWNIPTDRTRKLDEKNGIISQVIMFPIISQVKVIKT